MTDQNETPNEETVEMSTVETPVSNPDNAAEGTGAVAGPEGAPPNGTTPAGDKLSAYKQRLQELGREGVGAEIPLELADMMRAAAKARGDIALSAWIRLAFAEAVNAAGLTHVVDGASTDWKFDTKRLEETKARTSTRNLSPEEKKEKAEKAKAEAVDQRALVRRLLAEHRSKVLGGNA